MMSNPQGRQRRLGNLMNQRGSTLFVYWDVTTGGATDTSLDAVVGGTVAILSGTLKTFALEEPAKSVVRQFAEIRAGDLICDISPSGAITVCPGQGISGTVLLGDIQDQNIKFKWQGRVYSQADVGDRLTQVWDAVFGDVPLHRTLLLRAET
jgi:hypothetical protein